jgi:hypothetical protein
LAYTPLSANNFKGLRLNADPQDLGLAGAVDLKNVQIDLDGTVRTRGGAAAQGASALAGTPVSLVYVSLGHGVTEWVYAISNTNIAQWYRTAPTGSGVFTYDSTAAEIDLTGTGVFASDYTIFGTDADDEIKRVAPNLTIAIADLAFTAPTGRHVALAGFGDARIAVGYADDTVGSQSPSRVVFSGPIGTSSSAATWDTSDFVNLGTPEAITGMASFRDQLFVFKQNTFYVFYGTSTDATGGTIFNYREVDTGIGAEGFAVCAAEDGVYFVNNRGVYRTTGGDPQLVSADLQPFFDGEDNGFFSPTGPFTSPRVSAGKDCLYVWDHGTTDVFVMDYRTRAWVYWELPTAAYGLAATNYPDEVLFLGSTGLLYRISSGTVTDAGAGLSSHYQSGFVTVSDGSKTRVRGFHLTGAGTVSHATAVDLGAAGTTASVTLGDPGYDMRSAQGRDLSMKLSATSGAWSVRKWQALVAAARGVR